MLFLSSSELWSGMACSYWAQQFCHHIVKGALFLSRLTSPLLLSSAWAEFPRNGFLYIPVLWQKKKWILYTFSPYHPSLYTKIFSKYCQMLHSPYSFLDSIISLSLWLSSGTRVLSFMCPHLGCITPFIASCNQPSRYPTVRAMQWRKGNITLT